MKSALALATILTLAAMIVPVAPAQADCMRNGTSVICTGADADGVIVGDNFTIAVDSIAFVQSIYDGGVPSSCAEFVAAVRAGNGARITNRGLILGRGNCGLAIDTGNGLTLANEGTIATDQDTAYAVATGNGFTIQNSGMIQTVGINATGILGGSDGRLTNSAAGRIETTNDFSSAVFVGAGGIIVNDGRITARGLGSNGIDMGDRSTATVNGTVSASGVNTAGVRLYGNGATLINRGTIESAPTVTLRSTQFAFGVVVEGQNATIVNEAGTISGASGAVQLFGNATITNRGTLRGAGATAIKTELGGTFDLVNTGRVEGALTVNAGSRLSGTGTIAGHLQNIGTVAPGLSIGTMTVTGSFVQTGNGRLDIEVSGDGTSDRIIVGGPVLSLAGTVAVAFTGTPVRNGQAFSFISASSGVLATTRILPQVTDNAPAFLNANVRFGANGVEVVVARTPYASVAATETQSSVARALDGALASSSGATAGLFLALDLSDAAAARAAFDQLAPQALATLTQSPLAGLRTMTEGAGRTVATAAPTAAGGWRTWGMAAHHSGARSANAVDRYTAHATVLSAGVDFGMSDAISVGMMLGQSNGGAKHGRGGAAGRQDDDGTLFALTAAGRVGPVNAAAGLGLGDGEVETERRHLIGGAEASLSGKADTNATAAFARIDHTQSFGDVTLTPSISFDYARVRVKALQETGAFGLAVDAHTQESARSAARVTVETALGALRPRAMVGWSRQFADRAPMTTARIPTGGVGPFTLSGLREDRDVIEADIAAVMDLAPGAALTVGFGGGLNDRLFGQAVHAGISVAW